MKVNIFILVSNFAGFLPFPKLVLLDRHFVAKSSTKPAAEMTRGMKGKRPCSYGLLDMARRRMSNAAANKESRENVFEHISYVRTRVRRAGT